VIFAVLTRLDENQLATVKAMEAALEANQLPQEESQAAISAVKQTLVEIARRHDSIDGTLVAQARQAEEVIDAPRFSVTDRLKVTIPLIPFLLSYEGELDLESGANLEDAWKRLVAWVHRRP
jgi:hypothetical protein